MEVGLLPSGEGLNRARVEEGGIHPFFLPPCPSGNIFPPFLLPSNWIYTIDFPGSQAFRCRLNHATGSSLQRVGLLSVHTRVGQFLVINLHIQTCPVGSVSPENPD